MIVPINTFFFGRGLFMFDDLMQEQDFNFSDMTTNTVANSTQQNTSGYNSYQNKNNNYSNKNTSPSNFKKKEEDLDPYKPIVFYIETDFPKEVKDALYSVISRLVSAKYTIRINTEDAEFISRIKPLSDKFIELYSPWKNFNNIETKHYYSGLFANHIASTFNPGWEKIPQSVKARLARNIRMIFGDKNNSVCICVITWSADKASRYNEVTRDTGRPGFIIKAASSFGFPVLNAANPNFENIILKNFLSNA